MPPPRKRCQPCRDDKKRCQFNPEAGRCDRCVDADRYDCEPQFIGPRHPASDFAVAALAGGNSPRPASSSGSSPSSGRPVGPESRLPHVHNPTRDQNPYTYQTRNGFPDGSFTTEAPASELQYEARLLPIHRDPEVRGNSSDFLSGQALYPDQHIYPDPTNQHTAQRDTGMYRSSFDNGSTWNSALEPYQTNDIIQYQEPRAQRQWPEYQPTSGQEWQGDSIQVTPLCFCQTPNQSYIRCQRCFGRY